MQGKVMTVLGPVEPDTLGVTLTHEHLLIDLRVWCEEPEDEAQKAFVHAPVEMATLGAIRREPFGNLDNCVLDDTALAIEELRRFKTAGGGSVVDCTNNGLGRTPLALAEIAQATGINIVMGSGYYIGRSHPYDMIDRSVEMIADEIESDLMQGVADTGVRSGLIGEIGTSFKVRENEQKVLRAAARAQRRTGRRSVSICCRGRKTGSKSSIFLKAKAQIRIRSYCVISARRATTWNIILLWPNAALTSSTTSSAWNSTWTVLAAIRARTPGVSPR